MTRDLSLFGTATSPLRPSALDLLARCPVRAVLMYLGSVTDESGVAADTGSAVHAGVAEWHVDHDAEAGLRALHDSLRRFPKADVRDAEIYYEAYTADPRNARAVIRRIEFPVRAVLPGDIHIRGTLDQIREDESGVWRVWDLKTGKASDGWSMLHSYALQQAAYTVAAAQTLGRDVQPGGLIVAYGWRKKGAGPASDGPPGVFFETPWDLAFCYELLEGVADVVRRIRGGEFHYGPGDHCNYCPAGGLQGCRPIVEDLCR